MANLYNMAADFKAEFNGDYHDFLHVLEMRLSEVLREEYPEWLSESLDGIFVVDKSDYYIGYAVLIESQRMIPICINFELIDSKNEVKVIKCLLGELDIDKLQPYTSNRWRTKMHIIDRDTCEWKYVASL